MTSPHLDITQKDYTFKLPQQLNHLTVKIAKMIDKFSYCGALYKVFACYDTSNVFIVISKVSVDKFPSLIKFNTVSKFSATLPILINKERPKYEELNEKIQKMAEFREGGGR